MRRNPVDIKTARTWGDDGEVAFEMETAVREVLIEVAQREFIGRNGPGRSQRAVESMIEHPDTVRSSYSPVGMAMYNGTPSARPQQWPLEPAWNSVFVAPFAWDMNPPDYDLLFALATKQLNESWAPPGWEWFWDTVDPMAYPPLFEFSLGPKPWMWEQRYGHPGNMSNRNVLQPLDIADLRNQDNMIQAVDVAEEAAATRQNLLLLTPHAGITTASMIARRIVTLFPTWTRANLPFRAPHHTIGDRAMASEVYMAQYGVLYLDEVSEFSKGALRMLAAAIKEMKSKSQPLVVASMLASDWESRRNKDHAKIVGFLLVASVPVNRILREKTSLRSSAEIRDRIMARTRTNPAPRRPSKPQRIVAKLARELTPFGGSYTVSAPSQLAQTIGDYMNLANEVFFVLFLDMKNKVVGYTEFTSGAIASVEVHPGGIFQAALLSGAAAFITIHNHPSGNPEPSPDDFALWQRLREAGVTMGIPVLDNLVIGERGRYYSQSESAR